MMKRHLPLVLFALIALIHALPAGAVGREGKPNIIFIMADDLGYNELGCYGQKYIKTPHIDQLAAEGMKFTQFYSGQAVCAPTRCVLMTGKHTGHAYIRNNGNPKGMDDLRQRMGWEFPGQFPIPDSEVTIAELLKQQGYATGAAGKWGLGHFGTSGDPNTQGFDLFYGFNCQVHAHNHYPRFLWRNREKEVQPGNDRTLHGETWSQYRFVDVGLEFIRENKDRPFFLYLPFAVPHLSIQAPNETLTGYKQTIPEEDYRHRGYLPHPFPRAGYAAMVTEMDKGVGQVMALLKELGIDDNTVVFFTSDNGPTFNRLGGSDSDFFESAKPFKGLKGSLYEGGIRVPLIARWPGRIEAGTTSDLISAHWDVLPTLCDIAGFRAPGGLDGHSMSPTLLKRGTQAQHEFLYWEFAAYGGQQAIRMGKWKGVRQNMLAKNNPDPLNIELYNLDEDPGETNDMAERFPQIVTTMRRLMKTSRTPSEVFKFPPLDNQ
ncbi:MAG: arylsulfatase [Planctomycetota bacterium]|jgi:arylsulfatase